MPQGVQDVSLPGEIRDSTIYQGAFESLRPDHLAMPRLPSFALDSDNEMSSSQKSSSSQLFDFRKLGIRLSSQGSVTDSEDGFFNFSQEAAFTEVEGLLKNVFTRHSELDKGAVYDPTLDPSTPRSETPKPQAEALTEDLPDSCDSEQNMVTPQKSANSSDTVDPLTPMANLKMLISAASPEIRNRERAKQRQLEIELQEDDADAEDSTHSSTHSSTTTSSRKSTKASKTPKEDVEDAEADSDLSQPTSRKDKSLGLLCQRFLARYPEYPEPYENIRISLDEASKDLNVERRRIYDIVNVLESVEIVSRVAKNKYCWHGKTNLSTTLARLKALGRLEGFEDQLSRLKESSLGSEHDSTTCSPRKKEPFKSNDESNIQDFSLLRNSGGVSLTYNIRKDKSLGIMSQKFLMLFLVSEPRTVNLDMAAKILIGDQNMDKTESSKFKTKIRRLYDIANILTSLNLIRKVHVTETRGRKPAFQYVGPDVHVLNPDESAHPASNRPTSRHSLLDSKLPVEDATKFTVQEYGILRTGAPQGGSTGLNKRSFSRHSSFEQICQVAEQERNRLYFESRSQPTSPVKTKPHPLRSCSTIPTSSLQPTFNGRTPPGEHFVFIRGAKQTDQAREESEERKSGHPVTLDTKPEVVVQEVKAEDSKDGAQIATDSSKQTTVTLTKQDLNTIIQKLSNKDKPCLESADLDLGSTSGLVNSILEIVNKAQETESVHAADVGSNASHIRLVQLPRVQTGLKRLAAEAEDVEQPPTKRAAQHSPGGSTQAAPIPGVRRLWLEPDVSPKQQQQPQPSSNTSPTEQSSKPRDLYTPPATNSVLTPTFRLATTSPPVMMLPAQPETLGVPKPMGAPCQLTPSDQPRIVRKYVSLTRQPQASPLPGSLNGQAGGVAVSSSTSVASVPQNTTPTGRFFHNNPAVLGSRVVTPSGTVVLTNGHQVAGQQLSTPVSRVVFSSINSGSGPQVMPTSRVVVRKVASLTPQSQGMVTPTNAHALSTEIKPSSSIINLVPFLNSPSSGEQVSSRVPLRVVRIHRDSSALSPGQSQVTLVTPPQDLNVSGGVCTPQVSLTPSSSNAFYYSTPSALSPTQTATQVITTHTSAFQPVHTSLTARRLSMPKQ